MGELRKAGQIWKEFEDYLAPLMGMKPGERAMYSYLVRHTRLEGRRGVVLGMPALGRGAGLGYQAARIHLLRLARHGCVAVQAYRKDYAIEVFLPEEVLRGIRPRDFAALDLRVQWVSKNRVLRAAILKRERGRCFYCRKKLVKGDLWFDHVVALARGGSPDEGNVVACCRECNRWKGTSGAEAFLHELYKERRISKAQLRKRLAAIREILRGKHGLRKAA
jgi:hypothetical protein